MQARRLAKRSSLGSRRLSAAGPPSAGPPFLEKGARAVPKSESAWRPPRREGSAAALEEEDEEEDVVVDVEEEDDADEAEAGGVGSPPPELPGPGKGHPAARASLKVRRGAGSPRRAGKACAPSEVPASPRGVGAAWAGSCERLSCPRTALWSLCLVTGESREHRGIPGATSWKLGGRRGAVSPGPVFNPKSQPNFEQRVDRPGI